ncbi:MAG: methylenetetrahydrofolate reductase, partial [Gammaproteobacteria bacterium]
VLDVVRQYADTGVRHIVALRGDPPAGEQSWQPRGDGFANALELLGGIRSVGDFDISVAAYPETHPDAVSPQAELDYLKRKIDAGASRAITQFFFDNDAYLRFVDRTLDAGITVPIVPGILPVTNFARVKEFAARCNTSVPARFAALFEGLDEDPETRKLVAATVAAEQCQALQAQGVNEFHFYTLNRAELARSLCHILGLRASDLPDDQVRKAS